MMLGYNCDCMWGNLQWYQIRHTCKWFQTWSGGQIHRSCTSTISLCQLTQHQHHVHMQSYTFELAVTPLTMLSHSHHQVTNPDQEWSLSSPVSSAALIAKVRQAIMEFAAASGIVVESLHCISVGSSVHAVMVLRVIKCDQHIGGTSQQQQQQHEAPQQPQQPQQQHSETTECQAASAAECLDQKWETISQGLKEVINHAVLQ